MADPTKGGGESSTSSTKAFDPSKIAEEFRDLAKRYRLPNVDIDALMNSQRKNIEALTAANQLAIEATQSLIKRQGEILQETVAETSKAVEAISKSGSPGDIAAGQAELTKQAFERALANMRELAQMVTKANQDAGDVINSRISETLDEIKEMALKLKG